jgi:hypothetical protein
MRTVLVIEPTSKFKAIFEAVTMRKIVSYEIAHRNDQVRSILPMMINSDSVIAWFKLNLNEHDARAYCIEQVFAVSLSHVPINVEFVADLNQAFSDFANCLRLLA